MPLPWIQLKRLWRVKYPSSLEGISCTFPLNKIVIRNIFPRFIFRELPWTEWMHLVSPFSIHVLRREFALMALWVVNAKGTAWGITERHAHTFCNVVTLSPSPIVINHDALLFCCAMGLYLSWWYYSMRTLDILEWCDYSIFLSHCGLWWCFRTLCRI